MRALLRGEGLRNPTKLRLAGAEVSLLRPQVCVFGGGEERAVYLNSGEVNTACGLHRRSFC